MTIFKFIIAALAAIITLQMPCIAQEAPQAQHTYKIRMLWLPQAQFAGFYMAEADKLYEKAGLKVVIDHPTVSENIVDTLIKDEVDMIVSWPSIVIPSVLEGHDIVNIGQFHQNSSLMITANKKHGINKVEDLNGRRLGIWTPAHLRRPIINFLETKNIDCEILPILSSVYMFLYKGIDAMAVMDFNEYNSLILYGLNEDELVSFRFNSINPYYVDDGLYCKASTYKNCPEDCKKIMEITMEGWKRAFANPNRCLSVIKKVSEKSGININKALQKRMLKTLEKALQIGNNDGRLKPESFNAVQKLVDPEKTLTYEKFVAEASK